MQYCIFNTSFDGSICFFCCIFTILMKWIKTSSTHCYEWQSSLHEMNQIRKNRIFMFAIKYDKRNFFFFFLTFQWKCSTSDSYYQLEHSVRDCFSFVCIEIRFISMVICFFCVANGKAKRVKIWVKCWLAVHVPEGWLLHDWQDGNMTI